MIDQLLDALYPLLAALLAGSLVGLERGLRSEPAGFRTHALVCVAAAVIVEGAIHAGAAMHDTSASSRIAQGVITGIGFVGAGVIVRAGLSVRGLTTAASVWALTGIGIVFGYSRFVDGALGTAVLLLVLMGLRWFDRHLPRRSQARLVVRFSADKAMSEAELRALLSDLGIRADRIRHKLDNGVVEQSAQIHAPRDVPTESLSNRFATNPSVVGFDIEPVDA
ncbi:MAG TPA: MgtC/SapB family protein [Caulobacteraceae bacterium]|jgi:putative Mg2+ transporter-C (MgtC) family protein|nr:MgtC/SapB family protein [Caulobacteraceae bacterium]